MKRLKTEFFQKFIKSKFFYSEKEFQKWFNRIANPFF
jgi:hypothetical protein